MDARRNQTYTGLYRFDGNQMEIIKPQCAVGIDEIIAEVNKLGQAVVFLGMAWQCSKHISMKTARCHIPLHQRM